MNDLGTKERKEGTGALDFLVKQDINQLYKTEKWKKLAFQ